MTVKKKAHARMPSSDRAPASQCRVYVIELDPAVLERRRFREKNSQFVPGMPCVYVGSSSLSPEERRTNHLQGVRASRLVKTFGRELVPALYENFGSMPRAVAEQMEVQVAEKLRSAGYGVWQG